MVDHKIEHQLEVLAQRENIRPIPMLRIHYPIIDHRKTVVRGVGVKRQQMDL